MTLTAKPLVSIIIPLYNAENYVAETIKSALAQTWPNKEIIIINDGSTDNSLVVAQQFAGENVKVFSQQNKGASVARNYGLNEARGKYIQFLDADDLLSENKIEAQLKSLSGYDEYVGLCVTMHFQDGEDHLAYAADHTWMAEGSDDPADFLIKLYGADLIGPEYGSMIQPNAWLTPRSVIDKAGPWNEMRSPDDDGEFFCRVLLAGKGIKYAHDAVNYYRKFANPISWSGQKSYEASNNILQSTLLKVKHLTEATNDPRAGIALSRLLWENAFNLYPHYKDLSSTAEKKAKDLAPGIKYNPYRTGFNKALAGGLGWKTVKYLQYLKQKFIR
ncbi:MAG: glycosyltransferase [Bacteroidota bacterium]|nr:glycosyltransferase [Bacteroidota bacterium]